jgi:hypothetical protein
MQALFPIRAFKLFTAGALALSGVVGAAWAVSPAPAAGVATEQALQPLLDQLNAIGERIARESQAGPLERCQMEQAQVLFQIAQRSKVPERDTWLRLAVNSVYNAAMVAGEEQSAASQWLVQLPGQISQAFPGSPAISYACRQEIQADFERTRAKAGEKAARERLAGRLMRFAQDLPQAPEAPQAVMDAAQMREALKQPEDARQCYQYLTMQFPGNRLTFKAAVSLRRLSLPGQQVELRLPLLYAPDNASDHLFDLRELRGRVVVVYFWSSGSAEVAQNFQALNGLTERYGGRGVEVVYVNLDSDAAKGREFLQGRLTNGIHVYQSGGLEGPVAERYGIETLPQTFVVGRDGTVLRNGLQRAELLVEQIGGSASISKSVARAGPVGR